MILLSGSYGSKCPWSWNSCSITDFILWNLAFSLPPFIMEHDFIPTYVMELGNFVTYPHYGFWHSYWLILQIYCFTISYEMALYLKPLRWNWPICLSSFCPSTDIIMLLLLVLFVNCYCLDPGLLLIPPCFQLFSRFTFLTCKE